MLKRMMTRQKMKPNSKHHRKPVVLRGSRLPVIVAALLLGLTACQTDEARLVNGTRHESHVPPQTGTVGEALRIDETNTVTITGVTERSDEDISCIIVTYDWHNGGRTDATLTENVSLTLLQSGLKLEGDLSLLSDDEKHKLVTLNPAGETLEGIVQAFRPHNREPLTLLIEGTMLNVFVDGIPEAAWPVAIELDYPG